jgi:hypothetical protein
MQYKRLFLIIMAVTSMMATIFGLSACASSTGGTPTPTATATTTPTVIATTPGGPGVAVITVKHVSQPK